MRSERQASTRVHCLVRLLPSAFVAVLVSFTGLFLVNVAGCQKGAQPNSSQTPAAKSAITVRISGAAIAIHTPAADFELMPNGVTTASLRQGQSKLSLDADSPDSAQSISISGKGVLGVSLDLANADVKDATGKLGTLGKQINVSGKISGTDLEETATLEVYDSFPNLALLSIRLRNAGSSDVKIDSVNMQRHSFATPASSSAPSTPLWTFQGSSLKWGKDEIFMVPAKFSQENPFGAPVATKDDLGSAGGGFRS